MMPLFIPRPKHPFLHIPLYSEFADFLTARGEVGEVGKKVSKFKTMLPPLSHSLNVLLGLWFNCARFQAEIPNIRRAP